MSTLATSITTRLDRHLTEGDYESAADLARIAVNVHTAGLSYTPVPDVTPPRDASPAESDREWPEGVAVMTSQTDVWLHGKHVGFVMHPDFNLREFAAYGLGDVADVEPLHHSLDDAVLAVLSAVPLAAGDALDVELTLGLDAIDRALEKGRDDQREDEMRADFEAGAEALADRIEAK